MSWQVLITVFTLGGIGAMVRGGIIMILATSARIFPMAILLVNILAAYLGGFILSLHLPSDLNAALSIGLVGGIGTLSAIPGNMMDLFFDKGWRRLVIYFAITVFGGVLVAQAGISTGKFIQNLVNGNQAMQTEMLMQSLQQTEGHIDQLKQHSVDLSDLENKLKELEAGHTHEQPLPTSTSQESKATSKHTDATVPHDVDSLKTESEHNEAHQKTESNIQQDALAPSSSVEQTQSNAESADAKSLTTTKSQQTQEN